MGASTRRTINAVIVRTAVIQYIESRKLLSKRVCVLFNSGKDHVPAAFLDGTASERPFLYGKPEPLRVIDQYERALEQGFPLG
jgi:hypothetical protein